MGTHLDNVPMIMLFSLLGGERRFTVKVSPLESSSVHRSGDPMSISDASGTITASAPTKRLQWTEITVDTFPARCNFRIGSLVASCFPSWIFRVRLASPCLSETMEVGR